MSDSKSPDTKCTVFPCETYDISWNIPIKLITAELPPLHDGRHALPRYYVYKTEQLPSVSSSSKWCVEVTFSFKSTNFQMYVRTISLILSDSIMRSVTANFELSVGDDVNIYDRQNDYVFNTEGLKKHIWSCVCDVTQLSSLKISCLIAAEISEAWGNHISRTTAESYDKLMNDFRGLLNNDVFADVTIKVKGTNISAHKCVLAVRSAVFAAMFEHDMRESRQSCVEISDFDETTIQDLLIFLYTGRVPVFTYNVAEELLKAADKYMIDDLKDICETFLISVVGEQNAVQVLIFADTYKAEGLKVKALKYISPNAAFLQSDKMASLDHKPNLLRKIISKLPLNQLV